MGQGDPGRQHQAAGMKPRPKIGKTFHKSRSAKSRAAEFCQPPTAFSRAGKPWRSRCPASKRVESLKGKTAPGLQPTGVSRDRGPPLAKSPPRGRRLAAFLRVTAWREMTLARAETLAAIRAGDRGRRPL